MEWGTVIGTHSNLVATLKDTDSVVQFTTNAVTARKRRDSDPECASDRGCAGAATVGYATTNSTAVAASDYTAGDRHGEFCGGRDQQDGRDHGTERHDDRDQ
jgi:hypothetical protein